MDKRDTVLRFWRDAIEQNADALRAYFAPDAVIAWHNTDEAFTVEEYLVANCAYPGTWRGEVERVEETDQAVITVAKIRSADGTTKVHAVSFFTFENEKIRCLDEYWGDDGPPPAWRKEKNIGRPIQKDRDG